MFVWSAISTSLIGFVLQFTGLQGLHSSVAMYQLAATLIMALIRSLLRTQRLNESENLLQSREFQGQIEGHELDWQTLRIEGTVREAENGGLSSTAGSLNLSNDETSEEELRWSIVEEPPNLGEAKIAQQIDSGSQCKGNVRLAVSKDRTAAWTSSLDPSAREQDEWDGKCANTLVAWIAGFEEDKASASAPRSQSPNVAKRSLCYRSRLSYLTDDDAPTTAQRWSLEVRQQAIKLQSAIESVANYIFSDACQVRMQADWGTTAAFCWALNCNVARRADTILLPVHLMVHRTRGQWRIDICQLEAVLGLWTWSIKSEVEEHKQEYRSNNEEVETEDVIVNDEEPRVGNLMDYDLILSRKVFTVVPTQDSASRERAKRDLDIWVLREQRQPIYDTFEEQGGTRSGGSGRKCNAFLPPSLPLTRKLLFKPRLGQQDEQRQVMGLLSLQTENSVLVMATQDVFTSFIDALAGITSQLQGVNIVQSLRTDAIAEEVVSTSKCRPFVGLAHNHTERLVDIFCQSGLGTRDDALLSVISPLHSRSLLPSLLKECEQLVSLSRKLRGDGRWEQAENILMVLWDESKSTSRDDNTSHQAEELLRELGELYRKAMRSPEQSRRTFGYRGVSKMLTMRVKETNKVEDIAKNYSRVALELARLHSDSKKISEQLKAAAKETETLFNEGITPQAAMQFDSAYPIGLLMAELFKDKIEKEQQSLGTQLLLWAAQKGCKELVDDLLEAAVDVNLFDGKHRTPLSYACEEGHVEIFENYPSAGATIMADEESCTPFTWAVKKGRIHIVERFLKMNIDIESRDNSGRRPLSWAAEKGHNAVVKLLIDTGKTDINSKDSISETPLSRAGCNGYEAVVKLLLDTGKADIESKDDHDRTPL